MLRGAPREESVTRGAGRGGSEHARERGYCVANFKLLRPELSAKSDLLVGVPPAWPRAQAEALRALWQGSATPRADSARLPSPRAGEAALAGRAQVA